MFVGPARMFPQAPLWLSMGLPLDMFPVLLMGLKCICSWGSTLNPAAEAYSAHRAQWTGVEGACCFHLKNPLSAFDFPRQIFFFLLFRRTAQDQYLALPLCGNRSNLQ